MQPASLIVLWVALFLGELSAEQVDGSLLTQAIRAYDQRHVNAREDRGDVKKIDSAIALFEKGLMEKKIRRDVGFGLIKSLYFKATYCDLPRRELREIIDRALELNRQLNREYPDDVGLLFWEGVCLGQWAELHGDLRALRERVPHQVRDLMTRVIALDPRWGNGGGHRILGKLHQSVPRIPWILGWISQQEARRHLSQALKIDSGFLFNHFFMAELCLDEKDEDLARKHLKIVLEKEPDPGLILEETRLKIQARELWEKVN